MLAIPPAQLRGHAKRAAVQSARAQAYLASRHEEIVSWVQAGKSQQDMCDRLHVAKSTLRKYLATLPPVVRPKVEVRAAPVVPRPQPKPFIINLPPRKRSESPKPQKPSPSERAEASMQEMRARLKATMRTMADFTDDEIEALRQKIAEYIASGRLGRVAPFRSQAGWQI